MFTLSSMDSDPMYLAKKKNIFNCYILLLDLNPNTKMSKIEKKKEKNFPTESNI